MNNSHSQISRGIYNGMDSIAITGPFDFNDAQIDEIAMDVIHAHKKELVFDFSRVSYITSAGIACMIKALKKMQASGGRLYVKGATPDMVDLLSLTHLKKYLHFL